MKLKLEEEYLSIKKINEIDLPNFTVLTGLNGSGKTHILKGIRNQMIRCDNISNQSISLLSLEDLTSNQLKASTIEANCKFFLQGKIAGETRWGSEIRKIYFKHLGHQDAKEHHDLLKVNINKPIWKILKTEVDESLWEKIIEFKKEMQIDIFNSQEFKEFEFSNHIEESYKQFGIVSKSSGFHLASFINIIEAETLEALTKEFNDYNKLKEEYALGEFNKDERELRKDDYIKEYERNNPKPWDLFNECIESLRSTFKDSVIFNFQITSPDFKVDLYKKKENKASLYDKGTHELIGFDGLSSGEKVIFTLISLIFSKEKKSIPPKLILLDEIDATLHPSMIKAMLKVINDVFLEQKAKVILATHSPTTVALVQEESIYVVNHGNVINKIEKKSRSQALRILTEGYITIEDVLKFEDIPEEIIIVSEGKNYEYLLKAKSFFDLDSEIGILNVNVGGSGQLRTLFNLITKLNTAKTFFIVWDCDYTTKEERDENQQIIKNQETGEPNYIPRNLDFLENERTKNCNGYIFKKQENSQSNRGIENLFTNESTEKFEGEFNKKGPNRKSSFEKYILTNATEEMFTNFKPLFDHILKEKKQTAN